MVRRHAIALGLFAAALIAPSASRADLKSFFARPEPAYKWEKRDQLDIPGTGTVYDLHLVSQTWKNGPWEHRLLIYKPAKLKHPEFCGLMNAGGSGGTLKSQETQLGFMVANATGCMEALLYNIPNQPLYGGKTEDALVVYTWQQYLKTGDEDWPLHFPMAKAVLKAMDAIQEFARSEKLPDIDSFMVFGASKRGWTTWLVGASGDKRVKAIAPMVIDVLNVAEQIPHQLKAFGGKPSEQIADYSMTGMLDQLNTPAGKRLLALEDPYTYRDTITMPKLIVLGTNDPYWAQDALNLYWDGLKGPKWVSYTPNSGHGLDDIMHVVATVSAFIRTIAENEAFPKLEWHYAKTADGCTLTVMSSTPIKSARLYHNAAPTTDFRAIRKWAAEPVPVNGKTVVMRRANPKEGFEAIFGELTFDQGGVPYTLSTQVRILSASP